MTRSQPHYATEFESGLLGSRSQPGEAPEEFLKEAMVMVLKQTDATTAGGVA